VRLALAGILLLAFLLRIGHLWSVSRTPEFRWADPDHYLTGGKMLAEKGGWSFRAVRYEYAGRYYHLPPLYPAFLSLFSVFPDMELAAQAAQAILSVLAAALLFAMGKRLHSEQAGLIAAAIYAMWLPNIITTWFYQEMLYVPLIALAFVLLFRASTPFSFALAGAAFGVAALTRSMPLYYVPLVAILHVAAHRRRAHVRQAILALTGFAAPVIPYSLALSLHLGEATIIENHAAIILLSRDLEAGPSAGFTETAASVLRSLTSTGLIADLYGSVRSILHLNGGRLLQIYVVARDRTRAVLWKLAVHLFSDLTFAASLLLAPFGLVLARRRDASAALSVWILLNLFATSLGGFAGPRLRAPIEPHLIVAASVVLAGWDAPIGRAWMIVAAAASLAGAVILAPQVPRTLSAWPDYGVRWQHRPKGWRTSILGSAGFNALARQGNVAIQIRARRGAGISELTMVEVSLSGKKAPREVLSEGETRRLLYPWPGESIAYVELEAFGRTTGEPRELLLLAPPR
jgi:4-amino-4-deoxy-L-arabinose transferase-like glycosyltransferase